jgi:hypothetical protein
VIDVEEGKAKLKMTAKRNEIPSRSLVKVSESELGSHDVDGI